MSLILTHVTVQCPCSSLDYVSYYNSTVLQGLEIFPIQPAYEGKKKKKRGGPRVGVFVGLKVAFIISSYITWARTQSLTKPNCKAGREIQSSHRLRKKKQCWWVRASFCNCCYQHLVYLSTLETYISRIVSRISIACVLLDFTGK